VPEIHQLIPNPEDLLALEPEEVAPLLLQVICSGGGPTPQQALKRGNFFHSSSPASPVRGYPPAFRDKIYEVLAAAWVWLEREGMLLPAPSHQDPDWVYVSQRGRALMAKENFEAYRYSHMLPRKALHPAIAASAFALFMRGHYDTVVFEAFRAVEVAVRVAAGLPQDQLGVPLMRKAFVRLTGPLADTSLVEAEQEAMSNLFAGAIGLFKNPTSHRIAAIDKPQDAVDLVMFANYLLRLVDQRAQARPQQSGP
jgi:uncharacterized protein (TIGR02391 family)